MTRRAENICVDILNQLRDKAKLSDSFFSAVEETNGTRNTAHLLNVIRGTIFLGS
jgi:hypothetical protein